MCEILFFKMWHHLPISNYCTIFRLSPQFYIQHKDIESRCKGMEDFLANHGLNIDSKPSEVKAVKKKLELKRDLEGMDTSNIMDGNGRRSMRTTARRSYKYVAHLYYHIVAQRCFGINFANALASCSWLLSLNREHCVQ